TYSRLLRCLTLLRSGIRLRKLERLTAGGRDLGGRRLRELVGRHGELLREIAVAEDLDDEIARLEALLDRVELAVDEARRVESDDVDGRPRVEHLEVAYVHVQHRRRV